MKTNRNAVRSPFTSATSTAAAEPAAAPSDLLDVLIRRAADGDRDAIGALAHGFRRQLLAEACKSVQPADAEDVVQDLFVLLLVGSLRPPQTRNAAEWLLRTVARMAEKLTR